MKKIIIAIMIMMMLAGCSSANEKNENSISNENVQQNPIENESTENNYDWIEYYMAVGPEIKTIYFDAPFWTQAERGMSRAFTPDTDCCLYFTANLDGLGENDLYDMAIERILKDTRKILTIEGIETTVKENVRINDLDTIHFVGIAHETEYNRDLYITGYVFEYAGAACGVFGIVYDKNQPQELIDMINEYTAHMITTVRSEKKS